MRFFEVVKDLHDYIESSGVESSRAVAGAKYAVDLIPPGQVPPANNNIKLMYSLVGINKPIKVAGSLDSEEIQITMVAAKNNKAEVTRLGGVLEEVRKFVLSRAYVNKGVIMSSDTIRINYMADGFLPALMFNLKINYKN